MNQVNLIQKLKDNNIHVWSKTFAGKEEVFVEGRIEYFNNFVESLVKDVFQILEEHDQLKSLLTSNVLLSEYIDEEYYNNEQN